MKRLMIPLVLLLSACDNTAPPPPPKTTVAPESARLFDSQRQSLEKAHAVEGWINDAAQAQRKEIDAAEQR